MKILKLRSIDMTPWNDQKGFTMAELLVAAGLSLVVMGAVYSVYRVQAHTVKVQEFRTEAQEYARNALDMMVREMRNAGYFPQRAACPVPANTNGIVAATATTIQFVYDANGDGDCADAGENITYSYDPNTLDISRAADGGAAQPLTDANVTPPFQFVYFPRQTGAAAPAPYCYAIAGGIPAGCASDVATNLTNIQRISVLVSVLSKSTDTEFGGQQTITMDSNVELRNRGLLTP
jgi:prepilin-type N-terminal cleavage/methylation domain-containing protein